MVGEKPIVLIFVSYYLPGFKAGGILRTIANTVTTLHPYFQFKIVCLDRDLGDENGYPNIRTNEWITQEHATVFYLSPHHISLAILKQLLLDTPHDILYLNSLFDPFFTIRTLWLLRNSKWYKKSVLLAPRGELDKSGLSIKANKKKAYLLVSKLLGFYKRINWQASTSIEAENIANIMLLPKAAVAVAQDLPAPVPNTQVAATKGNVLRIVFLSRIAVEKNLLFAISVLHQVQSSIIFDIYGPIEHAEYWQKCQAAIALLPKHIHVCYKGPAEPQNVAAIFAGYQLFFLPTTGESYGHVIAESLSVGTPVLISENTPWKHLEQNGVGAAFPLQQPQAFVQFIYNLTLPQSSLSLLKSRSEIIKIYQEVYFDKQIIKDNISLFFNVLNG